MAETLRNVGGTSGAEQLDPKTAPTVKPKTTLAYSFPILFGFGTSGASHISESLQS